MNFGLKLWSTNADVIDKAACLIKEDVFQYIELTPIPNTEIDSFLKQDVPYVIHITTERHGFNIADKSKWDFNIQVIDECIEWADKLNAKYLVLHPGFGSIDNALDFLQMIDDDRILIENMPKLGLYDEQMIGYSPEQIELLMGSKFGFCLDLNHAVKAAISLRLDYKDFISEFMELNPSYFHIADGRLNYEKDEHLAIGKGEYDFEFLKNLMRFANNTQVTFETPRMDLNSFSDDIRNMNILNQISTNR
jgi:deoxyribonuclease-4